MSVPEEVFWSKVDRRGPDECWPWLAGRSEGRGRIRWNGRQQYAYRVAWELTSGQPIPTGLLACHSCDNPTCVNPGHIFVGTPADNLRDAREKGRHVSGFRLMKMEQRHNARPRATVIAVMAAYRAGVTNQSELARRFGVSRCAVQAWIRHGRSDIKGSA